MSFSQRLTETQTPSASNRLPRNQLPQRTILFQALSSPKTKEERSQAPSDPLSRRRSFQSTSITRMQRWRMRKRRGCPDRALTLWVLNFSTQKTTKTLTSCSHLKGGRYTLTIIATDLEGLSFPESQESSCLAQENIIQERM